MNEVRNQCEHKIRFNLEEQIASESTLQDKIQHIQKKNQELMDINRIIGDDLLEAEFQLKDTKIGLE